MEGKNQSPRSWTSDLFSPKDPSGLSPSALLDSIFESVHSKADAVNKSQDPKSVEWSDKGSTETASQRKMSKKKKDSAYYQAQTPSVPVSYCSSIFYGAPDSFLYPPINDSECSTLKKDFADSDYSRSLDWWKGSVYY